MALFRKKPVVIEAHQFFSSVTPWPEGVYVDWYHTELGHDVADYLSSSSGQRKGHFVKTLEGVHVVSEGDWIITGIAGERYPCKPEIFEKTYEPVKATEEDVDNFLLANSSLMSKLPSE